MVRHLAKHGHEAIVLDNFSTGHRAAIKWGKAIEADLLDGGGLDKVFIDEKFDAVMHFCARSLVGESVRDPYEYFSNNVTGTLNLLQAMRRNGVDRLVFSSTAAVFGNPCQEFIDESHPTEPINPYGKSKRMVELILADAAAAYGLRSVALRYFNAAGAAEDGSIGESHSPETHLIPNILLAALGKNTGLKVFGDDYPTRDGTCIRDYVHVDDLADAHLKALDFMALNAGAHCFNLGNGTGFSVLDIIAAARKVTGRAIDYTIAPRREGDPAVLVAKSQMALDRLGWTPSYNDIERIIDSAWRWHRAPAY
jgi:UDP-glucose 4-epimerase